MPFKTVTFCTLCEKEVIPAHMLSHEMMDCSELPANVAKREAAFKSWEKQQDEINTAWDAWQDKRERAKRPIIHAVPSVDHKPRVRAREGKCILVAYGDELRCSISKVLTNPTWGTVLVEFDKAIFFTKDTHNCFLKGLCQLRKTEWPKQLQTPKGQQALDPDITVLEFETGS